MDKYLLDTNVILQDPYILNKFKNSEIFIPSVVLQELDNKKNDSDLGVSVRTFGRIMDKIFEDNYITENNNKVTILGEAFTDEELFYLGGRTNDNVIIHTANKVGAKLLSNDILVRVKARGLTNIESVGLTSESSNNHSEEFYNGYLEYYLEDGLLNTFYRDKFLSIENIKDIEINPHMFIIFKRFSGNSGSLIGKINKNCSGVELINELENVWGINPKNSQQLMSFHLLLDNDIPLVVLEGMAGTGKTLLSLAAGLVLTSEEQAYKKLTIAKPIIDMGKELGILPGDMHEKLAPYLQSYYDNLEVLLGEESKNLDMFNIQIEALNYWRGRSIPDQFIIIDEVQNITRKEIKTILTRIGEGAKIILLGDIHQIDNPKLDMNNNALSYVIDCFKGDSDFGYMKLNKGVRSNLATKAAKLL